MCIGCIVLLTMLAACALFALGIWLERSATNEDEVTEEQAALLDRIAELQREARRLERRIIDDDWTEAASS